MLPHFSGYHLFLVFETTRERKAVIACPRKGRDSERLVRITPEAILAQWFSAPSIGAAGIYSTTLIANLDSSVLC